MEKEKKHQDFAQGVRVKTIKGKHGDFQLLKIDVEDFTAWAEKNKNEHGNVSIALYKRKVVDEYLNSHNPVKFIEKTITL
jgi:hypothetical protein